MPHVRWYSLHHASLAAVDVPVVSVLHGVKEGDDGSLELASGSPLLLLSAGASSTFPRSSNDINSRCISRSPSRKRERFALSHRRGRGRSSRSSSSRRLGLSALVLPLLPQKPATTSTTTTITPSTPTVPDQLEALDLDERDGLGGRRDEAQAQCQLAQLRRPKPLDRLHGERGVALARGQHYIRQGGEKESAGRYTYYHRYRNIENLYVSITAGRKEGKVLEIKILLTVANQCAGRGLDPGVAAQEAVH